MKILFIGDIVGRQDIAIRHKLECQCLIRDMFRLHRDQQRLAILVGKRQLPHRDHLVIKVNLQYGFDRLAAGPTYLYKSLECGPLEWRAANF